MALINENQHPLRVETTFKRKRKKKTNNQKNITCVSFELQVSDCLLITCQQGIQDFLQNTVSKRG